jgi:hypothetical protein
MADDRIDAQAKPPSTTVASEELALEAMRRELAELEARAAERRAAHEAVSGEIDKFCQDYGSRVGGLHVQLDGIRERTRKLLENWKGGGSHAPGLEDVPRAGAGARTAEESPEPTTGSMADESAAGSPEALERLKQAYRQAASLVHPDRARDPADREMREVLMAQVNAAYVDGDTLAIEDIAARYRDRVAPVRPQDRSERIARLMAALVRERERVAALDREVAALHASPWLQLKEHIDRLAASHGDGFDLLAERYAAQVREEQARLDVLEAAASGAAAPPSRRQRARPAPAVAAYMTTMGDLIHCTLRGDMVSCESEVAIANSLLELGLDYRYRHPFAVGGRVEHPSFTVFDAELRPLVWDHRRMDAAVDDVVWREKMAWYLRSGLRGGRDLFVTRDNEFGGADLPALRVVAEHLRLLVDLRNRSVGHGADTTLTRAYKSVVLR